MPLIEVERTYEFNDSKNHLSMSFYVMSGDPQGSHLGPLLFIFFINNIVEVIM